MGSLADGAFPTADDSVCVYVWCVGQHGVVSAGVTSFSSWCFICLAQFMFSV